MIFADFASGQRFALVIGAAAMYMSVSNTGTPTDSDPFSASNGDSASCRVKVSGEVDSVRP